MLGETVGFVAHVLQQTQGEGMPANPQWFLGAGQVDLFLAFGQ